jgi:hypothetical protein
MFQNVHPTSGRTGPVYSTSVHSGRNAENVPLRDDRYTRCRQCGFMNHLDRSLRAPVYSAAGDGITYPGWGSMPWGSSPWGSSDPTVVAGCSFCGSYLYA